MCGLDASLPSVAESHHPTRRIPRITKISNIHLHTKIKPKHTWRPGVYCSAGETSPSSESSLPRTAPPTSSTASTPPQHVCRECGGRRIIRTSAGPLPCPSCVPWRLRPDYSPGQLITMKDLNLSSFEDDSFVSQEEEDSPKSSKRRGAPMTEEKRLAIRLAMQNRGPLLADHKRRISNAMRARHAADPSIRQAGRSKRCSHCGDEGHNRKTCPELLTSRNKNRNRNDSDETKATAPCASINDNNNSTRGGGAHMRDGSLPARHSQRTCSLCGKAGHNRRSCPEAVTKNQYNRSSGSSQSNNNKKKVIVVEDEQESGELKAHMGGDDDVVRAVRAGVNDDVDVVDEGRGLSETENSALSQGADKSVFPHPYPVEGKAPLPSSPSSSSSLPPLAADQQPARDLASTILPPPGQRQLLRHLPGSSISLSSDGSIVFPLPLRQEQCVQQAVGAVLCAWQDGIRHQALELLLPQENSVEDVGWPGGIRQQFRAALPMVESLLISLKRSEGLQGRITAEWLDQGDCVGAWQSERLAAVLFPTAETLPEVQRIDDALSGRRLMLVINAQWQPQGQVVSEFGFGKARRAAERFVNSLEQVYYLRQLSILGDEVRVLRCYPGVWQVHYIRNSTQEAELLSLEDKKPTYQRLLELLQNVRGSLASKPWLERMLSSNPSGSMASYAEGRGGGAEGKASAGGELDLHGGQQQEEQVERDIVTGEVL